MKTVDIIKDRQEKFTLKRAWFVNAWRIVDHGTTNDRIQPWSSTLADAKKTCEHLGYTVIDIIK